MRIVRISFPLRNVTSWLYILGLAGFWSVARLFQPHHGSVRLPGVWLPPCPLKAICGFPCPFCGITTGCAWIVRGELREAWNSNILSPLLLIVCGALAAYTLVFRMIAGRSLDWAISGRAHHWLWLTGGLLVSASWLVNLLRAFS